MNLKEKLASSPAPIAAKKMHVHEIHGHQRVDEYFWLRDDKREDKDVLDYLEQETRYLIYIKCFLYISPETSFCLFVCKTNFAA